MNVVGLKLVDVGCSPVEDRSPQPTNLCFRRRMVQHNRGIGSKKKPVQASEIAWKTGVDTPDSPGWHITLSALEKRYLHAGGDGLSKETRCQIM